MRLLLAGVCLFGLASQASAAQWCMNTTSYSEANCAGDAQAVCTKFAVGTVVWPWGVDQSPATCSGNTYVQVKYVASAPDPCVAPDTWSSTLHACEAPAPPPCVEGDPAPVSWLAGVSTGEDWTYDVGSLTAALPQCDGTCLVTTAPSSEISCYSGSAVGDPVYCFFTGAKTGASCTVSTAQGGNANVTQPIQDAPVAGCPAGYAVNAAGACVQSIAAVAPAAATSTTPSVAGSDAVVTSASCPVGYVEQGGVCTSTAAADTTLCPAGYTRNEMGGCVGTATAKAASGIAPTPEERAAAESQAVDTASNQTSTGVQGGLDDAVAGYADKSGWFSWLWTPPVGECHPYAGTVHGYAVSWDLCPTVNNIRDVLGWLFAMFGAMTVYGQLFRRGE